MHLHVAIFVLFFFYFLLFLFVFVFLKLFWSYCCCFRISKRKIQACLRALCGTLRSHCCVGRRVSYDRLAREESDHHSTQASQQAGTASAGVSCSGSRGSGCFDCVSLLGEEASDGICTGCGEPGGGEIVTAVARVRSKGRASCEVRQRGLHLRPGACSMDVFLVMRRPIRSVDRMHRSYVPSCTARNHAESMRPCLLRLIACVSFMSADV